MPERRLAQHDAASRRELQREKEAGKACADDENGVVFHVPPLLCGEGRREEAEGHGHILEKSRVVMDGVVEGFVCETASDPDRSIGPSMPTTKSRLTASHENQIGDRPMTLHARPATVSRNVRRPADQIIADRRLAVQQSEQSVSRLHKAARPLSGPVENDGEICAGRATHLTTLGSKSDPLWQIPRKTQFRAVRHKRPTVSPWNAGSRGAE